MDQSPEANPQLPEAKSIQLGELFDPFKELSRRKIPENYSSTFKLNGLGTVVFRFSNKVPDEFGEYTLSEDRYVWVEVALDSNLTERRYEELSQGLDLTISNPATKREYLGFPEIIEPKKDRYKFNTWGLTHEWGNEVPEGNLTALLVKTKNIPRIMAIFRTPSL